jgi:hypothetical protein
MSHGECYTPELRAALRRVVVQMLSSSKLWHSARHAGEYKQCGKYTCITAKATFMYSKDLLERTAPHEKEKGFESKRG